MIPYFSLTEINLGFIKIQVWGLMLALGFLLGWWYFWRQAKRINLKENNVFDLAMIILVSALVGARLLYVLNEWPYFAENPISILKVWEGGMAFFGGLVFAVVTGGLYLRKKNIKFWPVADIIVITLALGEAVARIGCFLIHDHLGEITHLPWGIKYLGQVRHETALYSFLNALILFFILLIVKRKPAGQKQGFLTAFYLFWYGVISFLIYGLRATDLPGSDPIWWILRPSQYFCLILVFLALFVYHKIKKQTLA